MLGRDLVDLLGQRGHEVTATDRGTLDILDMQTCMDAVQGHDVVVNAAAWTAVDDAESREGAAFAVNAVGAANLARACAHAGAGTRLVQLSTDYVFDGTASSPYAEDAPLAPRSAYGRTKAAGEWAARALLPQRSWVLRTAWLYGEHGPNFVATMIRLERERDTVDVVADQSGQPTWTRALAGQVLAMVEEQVPAGVYHGTAAGQTTWWGLARAVFAGIGADPERVRPTTTAAFPRPAPRPAYSVLGHGGWAGTGVDPLPDWSLSLQEALRHLPR